LVFVIARNELATDLSATIRCGFDGGGAGYFVGIIGFRLVLSATTSGIAYASITKKFPVVLLCCPNVAYDRIY
jgi:hypothetical protein